MKKPIFILTYNEGKEWCDFYDYRQYHHFFNDKDYQLIFLDNGNQESIKEWCERTNSIHFVSENNIGTTGGYNWFIRVGDLLKAPRIAVMQADVQVYDPICFELLFRHPLRDIWNNNDFVYYPNQPRSSWDKFFKDGDVGQFFSLDPTFFIQNDYLCDENYTVTHFESTDLFIRMLSHHNLNRVIINNLFRYFPNKEANMSYKEHDESKHLMSIQSYTNREGLHNQWLEYNYDYFRKKWMRNLPIPMDVGIKMWKTRASLWIGPPWEDNNNKKEYEKLLLHRRPLNVHRNINVGQLPYPVEWEVNRFYKEFIVSEKIKISDYQR